MNLTILDPSSIKVINYIILFSGVTYTFLWCPFVPYPKSTLSTTFVATASTTTCYKKYNCYCNSSPSGFKYFKMFILLYLFCINSVLKPINLYINNS